MTAGVQPEAGGMMFDDDDAEVTCRWMTNPVSLRWEERMNKLFGFYWTVLSRAM